jgi:hypothetical protein
MKEALKLALEALKLGDTVFYPQTSIAIAAIKKALAQPAQEPVAQDLDAPLTLNGVALYPQRPWVGLTDEERGKVYADWRWSDGKTSNLALCEAIEAKLKEKNT